MGKVVMEKLGIVAINSVAGWWWNMAFIFTYIGNNNPH